ncbi:MAG: CoA transferase [Pseudomonadota bacterium]|nr:CoA transferase [Pseudomonadota bacterium]
MLARLDLSGAGPMLQSSFAVATAAQASLAAAALAAATLGEARNGVAQRVAVDRADAAAECTGRFRIDGRSPELWDPIAGLYACGDVGRGGWVRLHTNFAHHRDGVLRLLDLPVDSGVDRAAVAAALLRWSALEFEAAASAAGLVVAAARSSDTWRAHPQYACEAAPPLIEIERIGDAPARAWPALAEDALPLHGLRVLDLTRILAGPVAGRTLAHYGADVLLVNAPHLPNIAAIADTSRGKRSALADLRNPADRAVFDAALREAHVMVQGYRPGGLDALALGPAAAAELRPGLVYVTLSAYSPGGPWASRRGFDSLVQTATGFNIDEGAARAKPSPTALPLPILDMASAFFLALGTQAALLRQQREGGSWHVRIALARTGLWLRSLGRVADPQEAAALDVDAYLRTEPSGFGELACVPHAARFARTPIGRLRPAVAPGTDPLRWK